MHCLCCSVPGKLFDQISPVSLLLRCCCCGCGYRTTPTHLSPPTNSSSYYLLSLLSHTRNMLSIFVSVSIIDFYLPAFSTILTGRCVPFPAYVPSFQSRMGFISVFPPPVDLRLSLLILYRCCVCITCCRPKCWWRRARSPSPGGTNSPRSVRQAEMSMTPCSQRWPETFAF